MLARFMVALGLLAALGTAAEGQSFTIKEVSGRRGNNTPVTLSFFGAQGDFFGQAIHPIVNGTDTPAQVDVRSTWPDGSISHALITFFVTIRANETLTVTFAPTALQPGGSFTPDATLIHDLPFQADFQELNGRHTALNFDAYQAYLLLRAAWWAAPQWRGSAYGPLMREIEWNYRPFDQNGTHPNIEVIVRWRIYSGYPGAFVEFITENCRTDSIKDDLEYTRATIKTGRNLSKTVLDLTDQRHLFQTRCGSEAWVGQAPVELRIRPSIPYLARIGLMPPIDDAFPVTESQAANYISHIMRNTQRGQFDESYPLGVPFNNGPIFKYMPGAGDRQDIGWYPKWAWLALNGDNFAAESLTLAGDMNASGVYPVHNRDMVTNSMGLRYHNPWWSNKLKFQPRFNNPFTPNVSHMPLLGMSSYILTGRKVFLEEMVAWTCYAIRDTYPNNGQIQNVGDRKAAWNLRNVAILAAILPDDHPLRGYFRGVLDNTAQTWSTKLDGLDVPWGTFGNGGWKASGRESWPVGLRCSPWQNAWFTAMCWTTWRMHGIQEYYDLFAHNWEFFRQGYLAHDTFQAPNGEIIQSDPGYLMQYSKLISIYTPEIKINGGQQSWGVLADSIVPLTNWAESLWYERICLDFPVQGPNNPQWPAAGPEPIHWRPQNGSYSPPPANSYDEYGPGRVGLLWIAALEGMPQSAQVLANIEPWIDAQINAKSAPHYAGMKLNGAVYTR